MCSRFVLNVPKEDQQSFERILFLVEYAHWFYEDNTVEKNPSLKSFNLKEFTSLSILYLMHLYCCDMLLSLSCWLICQIFTIDFNSMIIFFFFNCSNHFSSTTIIAFYIKVLIQKKIKCFGIILSHSLVYENDTSRPSSLIKLKPVCNYIFYGHFLMLLISKHLSGKKARVHVRYS